MFFKSIRLFLPPAIIWLFCSGMIPQNEDPILKTAKDLSLTLDKTSQKKIEKAQEYLLEAESVISGAGNPESSGALKADLAESIEKTRLAEQFLKEVYDKILDDFYQKANRIYINKFDHARYYDQKVEGYLNAGERYWKLADTSRINEIILAMHSNALENFKLAMINQLRAIRIYQDFPIEYPYDWDDFFKEKQIMLAREQALLAKQEEREQQARESFIMIYFRVQIAAHTVEIPDHQLRQIYSGNLPVQVLYENGWYKYMIGNFIQYNQAVTLLKECNIRKAFIVAYDDQNVKQNIREIPKN